MNIKNRDNWDFSYNKKSILKDKDRLIRSYINYMLIRTQKMFEYENLPKTIPQKDLELITQLCGYSIIAKAPDGELYAFIGGLGGQLNEYYQPTLSVVANPYLKLAKTFNIDDDCIVVLNDSLYVGLTPMFDKYGELLAETLISIRFACINSRLPMVAVASDDNTAKSINDLFESIEKGDTIKSVVSKQLLKDESLETRDYFNKNMGSLKDLIELHQYLLSSWYNEIGVQSNYNMKRESLNSNEVGMNEDLLIPLIDEMLNQRQLGWDKVNKKFGTNVKVKLSSVWQKLKNQALNKIKGDENEV